MLHKIPIISWRLICGAVSVHWQTNSRSDCNKLLNPSPDLSPLWGTCIYLCLVFDKISKTKFLWIVEMAKFDSVSWECFLLWVTMLTSIFDLSFYTHCLLHWFRPVHLSFCPSIHLSILRQNRVLHNSCSYTYWLKLKHVSHMMWRPLVSHS